VLGLAQLRQIAETLDVNPGELVRDYGLAPFLPAVPAHVSNAVPVIRGLGKPERSVFGTLWRNRGEWVNGGMLGLAHGYRARVVERLRWKLADWGYTIESMRGRGYRLAVWPGGGS
jgi:hypothetical protein